MSVSIVILAAGQGSRMKSDLPKVLHHVAGAPLLVHSMRSARAVDAQNTVVVIGHGGEAVGKAALAYDDRAQVVEQTEQLGTAHAVLQAKKALSDFEGRIIVLYGDTPFVSPETLQNMLDTQAKGNAVVVLGFEAENPGGYGRLVLCPDGHLEAIVEAKDANDTQRAITFCNSGVVCADRQVLFDLIAEVSDDNANQEFYLTDIVAIARAKGLACAAVSCDAVETMGVNSRHDLARAEAAFQANARFEAMENGTTLTVPETVFFAFDTYVGRDVTIGQNVVFGPGVTIESGAAIHAFSHLEGCHISQNATIGPYARLRPGAEIGDGAKVGNFVEVKTALVGEGAKINHLSYVGDAVIGDKANIGAGTITCNYDGVMKHKTVIGARSFIGSNTALVAPVRVGDNAMTASGSVITSDVPDEALGVARSKQVNKAGFAVRLMKKLKAAKAALSEE